MARKRAVYDIRKVNIADVEINSDGIPVAQRYTLESVSECRAFRMYNEMLPPKEEGGHPILRDWVNVDFKPRVDVITGEPVLSETAQYYMAEAMLRQGIIVDGELFVRCIRSASQVRSGEALFVRAELDRDKVRERLSYGAHFGKRNQRKDGSFYNPFLAPDAKVENLAKMEARYGLAASSSLDSELALGRDLTFSLEEDVKRFILTEVYRQGLREVEITPADGMGTIRPAAALQLALKLGLLPVEVFDDLMGAVQVYGFLGAVQRENFRRKWLKYIPAAFQIRCAGIKGLMVVFPHDEVFGRNVDLVVTESQWKYSFAPGEHPTIEVCAWEKPPKSKYVRLNYQFIQALSITAEELIGLAHSALSRIERTVLADPASAMAFLGMIASSDEDEEYEETTLVSTITRTLNANPYMLSDFYIQKSLRKILKRTITDMRKGRIPVEGEYRYLVADPSIIFGFTEGILQKGEYWVPGRGREGQELAAFRSPLIHRSEVLRLKAITREVMAERLKDFARQIGRDEAWAVQLMAAWEVLFQGCLVFNVHDDILPRMGGADVDGDRVLVTPEPVILQHVTGGPLLVTESREGTWQEITWDNLIAYDLTTVSGDRIGTITNLATTKVDKALCEIERLLHAGEAGDEEPEVFHISATATVEDDGCPF